MLPSLPLLGQLASQPFKRSQTGLFHGKLIQFGNNVPFSKKKTRRTWLPNIQQKGLRSEVLNREFTLKVTTKALKTIKKLGGLDQYVLRTPSDILGPEGMRIRIKIRDTIAAQEAERDAKLRFEAEIAELRTKVLAETNVNAAEESVAASVVESSSSKDATL